MSIVFFKKFLGAIFSQSHIWNAHARARVRYIRAKKFLVCACKTYTMRDNREGVRKEIECTISCEILCYVVFDTIYSKVHKYAVNKNGTKRDYSIKSTFRVYYKTAFRHFSSV